MCVLYICLGVHPSLSWDSDIESVPIKSSQDANLSKILVGDDKKKFRKVRELFSHLFKSLGIAQTIPTNLALPALKKGPLAWLRKTQQQPDSFNSASDEAVLVQSAGRLLSVSPTLPRKMHREPTQWKMSDYCMLEQISQVGMGRVQIGR